MTTTQFKTSLTGALALWGATAMAGDIQGACMASFNVDPNATVMAGTSLVSCGELEQRRVELFQKINALPSSGLMDTSAEQQTLAAAEQRLKSLQDQNDWLGISTMISGNFLATLSLGACGETMGAGCALAVVGKVISIVGIVHGASSDSDKSQAISDARATIDSVSASLANKQPSMATVRASLVNDFNGLCSTVRQSCIAH